MKLAIAILGVLWVATVWMAFRDATHIDGWYCQSCWMAATPHRWASEIAHEDSVLLVRGRAVNSTNGLLELVPASEYQIDFCVVHGESRVRKTK